MARTLRLTMAQALVKKLASYRVESMAGRCPTAPECGPSSAMATWPLSARRCMRTASALPTYRAHNEQAMAHAAIAYGKANFRRRIMAVTTSIGPGATNLITGAALAHVNRLPVLLLPGDIFVSRAPDPVLQQVEDFQDGGVSANDCFKPVSRYFDRIMTPEQLLTALPRAIAVMTDPALCGPGDARAAAGHPGRRPTTTRPISSSPSRSRSARRRRTRASSSARLRCCVRRSGRF